MEYDGQGVSENAWRFEALRDVETPGERAERLKNPEQMAEALKSLRELTGEQLQDLQQVVNEKIKEKGLSEDMEAVGGAEATLERQTALGRSEMVLERSDELKMPLVGTGLPVPELGAIVDESAPSEPDKVLSTEKGFVVLKDGVNEETAREYKEIEKEKDLSKRHARRELLRRKFMAKTFSGDNAKTIDRSYMLGGEAA